jgi:hypothetical protein
LVSTPSDCQHYLEIMQFAFSKTSLGDRAICNRYTQPHSPHLPTQYLTSHVDEKVLLNILRPTTQDNHKYTRPLF